MFSVHKYWHLALFGKNRKEVKCCCVCLDTFMLVESAGGGGGGVRVLTFLVRQRCKAVPSEREIPEFRSVWREMLQSLSWEQNTFRSII